MDSHQPKLHIICGKIASGKSTLATELSKSPHTILIREDEWLSALYPNEIISLEDYIRCTQRLKSVMGDHIIQLLKSGQNVVLDFQANTVKTRAWMKNLISEAQADHELHFLDISNEVCKERLRKRNESRTHQYQTNEQEFDVITSFFVAPQPEENFHVKVYT